MRPSTDIVLLRTGSHLYGTATCLSDLDLKSVHLPAGRDILLQQARPTQSEARARDRGERNRPGDTDLERTSLQRFLDMVLAGQPAALEMLFAPDDAMMAPPHPLWRAVQALAPRLVSRKADMFLRYCTAQADRYGVAGARAATASQALALLRDAEARLGGRARLEAIAEDLAGFVQASPHAGLVEIATGEGRRVRHLDLCGRRMPLNASLAETVALARRLVEEYGARTLAAGRQAGIDWKSLSQAVRVAQEAIELLETGRLRFPLAGAAHLLDIRSGRLPQAAVTEEIERLPAEVDAAARRSSLPEAPDVLAAETLLLDAYRQQVLPDDER